MKIEEAFDGVIEAAKWFAEEYKLEELKKAISILRDGEDPVEVVEEVGARKCRICGMAFIAGGQRCECPPLMPSAKIRATKTYTTTRRITTETVESEPVFEEIEDE